MKLIKEGFTKPSERKSKFWRDLPVIWHLWFVFIRLLFAPFALPILFSLFIGRPNCMSWNEISGEEKSDEEREVEIERDQGGKGMETEELHTWFPPSPWSEVFRAMLVWARDHRLAVWNLADKVAQSCVHYEIREAEGYDEWKKWNAEQRRGGSLLYQSIYSRTRRRVAYFLARRLNLYPRARWSKRWQNFQLPSLNAISVSSNYAGRHWSNSNKRKFYVSCNLMCVLEIDCEVDWN